MNKALEKTKLAYKKMKDSFSSFFSKVSDHFFSFLHKYDLLVFLVVITILSFVLRWFLLDCVRGDFTSFLRPWYERIYNDGFKSLGESFGDYTPAYYYILWLLSLFRIDPNSIYVLWGIKFVSIIFDYVLATFVYLITKEVTGNKIKSALAYTLTVFGLTIFLNSALWGQCDSIYVSFVIMSIYYLLKHKNNKAMILYGVAFSFKLQAIFLLPFLLVLFLRRKFKLRYLLWVPLVYVIFALPASFASDNFFNRLQEILLVYFNQSANSYKQLTLNAGTFYALIFTNFKNEEFISSFALFLAIAIIGTYMFFIYRSKAKFTKEIYTKSLLLLVMIVPYFLPHMHERYFYLVDVVVILYALVNPKRFYVALLCILNSMIGYMVYLWNIPFINVVPEGQLDPNKALSFRFGASIYLIAIIIVSIDLFKELYPNGLEEGKVDTKVIETKEENKQELVKGEN